MVISKGIAAKRVAKPKIKSAAQNTSANTVSAKDVVAPNPIGSGNWIGSVPNNGAILLMPCVNIKAPPAIRSISNEMSMFLE